MAKASLWKKRNRKCQQISWWSAITNPSISSWGYRKVILKNVWRKTSYLFVVSPRRKETTIGKILLLVELKLRRIRPDERPKFCLTAALLPTTSSNVGLLAYQSESCIRSHQQISQPMAWLLSNDVTTTFGSFWFSFVICAFMEPKEQQWGSMRKA